ncbi:MAG: nitroreductase family protein [Flavobacteriales bacterium]|nr:nitroreductase family protein [Flavobacteriales bacterium]
MTNKDYPFVKYSSETFSEEDMIKRSAEFYDWADARRSVRDFSDKSVPLKVMENILLTASTAPSGAHKQPWTFCLISNAELKSRLRELAEEEEKKSYGGRMSKEWLEDLAPLGTDWQKEFIDIAPWIVVVMKRAYEFTDEGKKRNNYYVSESVGLASGFLLMAIHNAGLVALTHTPSPMNFIAKALERPDNERPFLLIPVGHPAENAMVPDLERKSKDEIIEYYS